jgi:hypothetical protein
VRKDLNALVPLRSLLGIGTSTRFIGLHMRRFHFSSVFRTTYLRKGQKKQIKNKK